MHYIDLGATGLRVSRLAFGASSYGSRDWMPWALSEDDAQPHYRAAFEHGFNLFDTAESYSSGLSEEILGRAIKRYGTGRDRVVIATKAGLARGDGTGHGLSRKRIRHAIDDSLRRLGTDYIDLYQIHRLDPHTPLEEVMLALDDVVRAGKALYIGASSMHAWQFATLQQLAGRGGLTRFSTMQNKYNLLYREEERETLPLCLHQNVAVLPYSPWRAACWRAAAGRTPNGRAWCAISRGPRTSRWWTASSRSPPSAAPGRRRSRWPGCCTTRR